MARSPDFTCSACGARHPKWAGRCEACGAWNTLAEEAPLGTAPGRGALGGRKGRAVTLAGLRGETAPPPRTGTGLDELDRVLGGGLVPASAILVGGDPGIGKSTLLLQAAARVAQAGGRAVYVSGEEAADQIRMRAARLGLSDAPLALAAETGLRDILTTLDAERPDLAVIDSIQTMWSDSLDAAPGSVGQVRAAAQELVQFAKRRGTAVVLVGHVTKDGQIAGPRVVEHMVDTVLYFEGERGHRFRLLRAVKNRFGPADEIGVFEMTGAGLAEVANPSALFLSDRMRRARPARPSLPASRGRAPCWWKSRRWWRNRRWPAAAHGGRPRSRAAGDDPGRARRTLRDRLCRFGCLPQRRGGLAHRRTGGRSGGRCGVAVGARGPAAAARDRGFRRDQPVGRPAPGAAERIAVERGAETWFHHGATARGGRGPVRG
jgi:hypothetical protein